MVGKIKPYDRIEHPLRQVDRDITSIEAIEDLPFVGQDGGDYTLYDSSLNPLTNNYRKDMKWRIYKVTNVKILEQIEYLPEKRKS